MADYKPQGTQDYAVETGYEAGDANVKAVVAGLSIILASTLVVMAAMFGMFNYLNRQANEAAARVPVALTERVVPPEPRLLPMPYTDERAEAAKVGATTPDVMPWDKRNLEIVLQYDESNSYAKYKGEGGREAIRIPLNRAIELEAGMTPGKESKAPAAIMTWQPEHPALVAGTKNGTMNLIPGQKNVERTTFDDRPYWETQDEKFNSDSSGGLSLRPGQLSR
ncbi:MAG TPA: hypothetical protein VGB45_13355 [Abditibacterium sp.]|jgi:hypothetical protein